MNLLNHWHWNHLVSEQLSWEWRACMDSLLGDWANCVWPHLQLYFTYVYVSILQSCSFDFCKKSRKEWRLEARDRYWHKAGKTSGPLFRVRYVILLAVAVLVLGAQLKPFETSWTCHLLVGCFVFRVLMSQLWRHCRRQKKLWPDSQAKSGPSWAMMPLHTDRMTRAMGVSISPRVGWAEVIWSLYIYYIYMGKL